MTIWEKAVRNMEKGTRKLAVAAATFSEWVKTELAVIRLRIKIDEAEAGIDGLHRQIGRTVRDLQKRGVLPSSTEQLLKDEVIGVAMTELADREQDLERLKAEIKDIRSDYQSAAKQTEDTLP